MEEEFDRLGIRYIAIMDNIDTAKGISDLVPMQDLFNEWHAKNTSQKVRNVFKSKGMSGQPLTTIPPFGYMKSPESTKHDVKWDIDEPAAEIVKLIFKLCVDGLGPSQIAKRLKAERIMTPTEYWDSIGRKAMHLPETPFNWSPDMVSVILARQEYCGDTINFRTTTKSFKNKKTIDLPRDNWKIFPDTHPAIIDRETFALVQELRSHRRRPTRTGKGSMFSGLLYCADCGSKLYYSNGCEKRKIRPNFFCSSYRKSSSNCSAHYIREAVIGQTVLETMQRIFQTIALFEDEFVEKQRQRYGIEEKKVRSSKKRELDKSKKRISEVDTLIQRLYEDNVKGKIDDDRFAALSFSLEAEQKELKQNVPKLEVELTAETDKDKALQSFVNKARQLTEIKELTPEIVHEFIEKIIVHAPKYTDGKRIQVIDIYFNGVGIVEELTPEEMEKGFQAALKARKTA